MKKIMMVVVATFSLVGMTSASYGQAACAPDVATDVAATAKRLGYMCSQAKNCLESPGKVVFGCEGNDKQLNVIDWSSGQMRMKVFNLYTSEIYGCYVVKTGQLLDNSYCNF
jgi:hypothetical protein